MLFTHNLSKLIVSATLLALVGCSLKPTQPDYNQEIEREKQTIADWQNDVDATGVSDLNDLINAPEVMPWVETALNNNPSLQQTLLTLLILEKQHTVAEAARLPMVGAGFGANRIQDSDDSFNSELSISWQVDLWGQLSDLEQAAQQDIVQQSLLLQSARDTLAAEVMSNWLTLIAQQRAADIESQRLNSLKQTEAFILARYQLGLGVLEDLDSARTAVASSEARLTGLRENQRQQQIFLRTLLGQTELPSLKALPADYPTVLLPLADLPEQTLARRPDLQAAYVAILAADLRTDAAYKDLLPRLDFQAILQDAASSPREALFGAPAWSLLGQLTAPLYEGGQRKATAEINALQTAINYQAYRDQLLTAVTEIEQALSFEQALQSQQQSVEKALASAENNLLQYRESYQNGLRTILDLLTVQQQNFDLQAQRDDLIYQRLLNRINLGLALGMEINA
ncbi:TolC family protein [Methylophaga sp. OBS3]|uniref:TolC family protein n=1 Tax=Methylophaga sp. OBS3 TaxID=2991934 RepID=UPI002259258C|nr:TolC family protein [Methylophaga sp. OBS3]